MAYNPRTDEILANGPTAGNQTSPSVTRLANGNVLVVYATPTTAQNQQWGIQGQLFDPFGNKINSFFWITNITLRSQSNPDVAALPDGGFALTWNFTTLNTSQTNAAIFDAAGNKASGEIFIDSNAQFLPSLPEIAGLANGSAAIVWNDNLESDPTVGGAILAPNGAKTSFSVVTNADGSQSDPKIASLAGGNFVVTWADSSGVGGDSDTSAIKAQIFDGTGAKVGGELLVNTTTAGAQGTPFIAGLPSGGFVIVWDSPAGDRGQLFDAAGNKVGAEFAVPGAGEITTLSNGGFVVAFTATDASGSGVYGQQFAPDGSQVGSPFLVNAVTSGEQIRPELVAVEDDELFIVWQDNSGIGGDSDGTGIKARIFTSAAIGTEGIDSFVGTPGDDQILGLGGNDVFQMQQGGDDDVEGGSGDDLFYFGGAFTAADRIDGGAGSDVLVLQGQYPGLILAADSLTSVESIVLWTSSNNTFGGAGGSAGNYVITTGDANVAAGRPLAVDARQLVSSERLAFDGSAETNGVFFLYGGAADDSLTGGALGDSLDGGIGADTMAGGGGDDIYFIDNGGDLIVEGPGGGGFDALYSRVNYYLRAGVHVELLAANGVTPGQAMTLIGNELVQSIIGASGNDALYGGGGDDFLLGNEGDDTLDGGEGLDVMNGGAGNDLYFVDDSRDVVQESVGGGGFDAVYASADYGLPNAAEAELLAANGLAPGVGILLSGNDFDQTVVGASGSDYLFGGGGRDVLVGNDGTDQLDGGTGADIMNGGAGDDIYFVDNAGDVVQESAGGGGQDAVYASASFALAAGAEVELIAANGEASGAGLTLTGSDTAQSIVGAGGNDVLSGAGGNDSLTGNEGNDILDGGAGLDGLSGGGGADMFRFASASHSSGEGDAIFDFAVGLDKIDLSAIDANVNVPGDQAFAFIGSGAFTNVAGQLRAELSGGVMHILGDVNGDGVADLHIAAYNVAAIGAGDFIL